jgi:hypothetical protein
VVGEIGVGMMISQRLINERWLKRAVTFGSICSSRQKRKAKTSSRFNE